MAGRRKNAPLYEAARAFINKNRIPFHVPLHGQGKGAPKQMKRIFGSSLKWDLTEVDFLDDLHRPHGALKKSQQLAAELFGAKKTFFLVNGVTGGMLALFKALCSPGDYVVLSRISHKSAINGITLSGAVPRFIPVEREPNSGLPLNVSPEAVERALQEEPAARLVLVTSPSYWGVAADLEAIANIVSRYGALLVVDEAHGGHLPFYRRRIPHSSEAGADLWLQSAHKSLGSLTPGAFLHLGSDEYYESLSYWLQVLQTSSPPYPVMVSLDLARQEMALTGRRRFRQSWRWAQVFRYYLKEEKCRFLESEDVEAEGFVLDPCRLTLLFRQGEGQRAAQILSGDHRVQLEIEESDYLLAVIGPAILRYSPRFLARCFKRAAVKAGDGFGLKAGISPGRSSFPSAFFEEGPKSALSPQEALRVPARPVALEKGAGQVSAETVTLSPPGIPLVVPGEVITDKIVSYLQDRKKRGARFQGVSDPALDKIRVLWKN